VVDSLVNVQDDKKEGWIYFVASTNPDEENVYDEFIWVDDKWEQIGSTSVTLPAAGDYLSFDKDTNTYNVDFSTEIKDDNTTVPTTKAVFDYINEQETHEEWHKNNNYKHIDIFEPKPFAQVSNNKQAGVITTGFILKIPYFSQLEKLQVYGTYSKIGAWGQGAGTGNSAELFENLYVKIIDQHTNEVIAISKGSQAPETPYDGYIVGNAVFEFDKNNQPILLSGEEYKVIFSSTADVNDITNLV
jgi:hypothetical protein